MLFKMTPVLRYYKNLYHKKNKHRYLVWTGIPSSTTLNNTVFLIQLHFSPMTSPQGDFLTKKKAYINMSHSVRKPNLRFGSLSWVGCDQSVLLCISGAKSSRQERSAKKALLTKPDHLAICRLLLALLSPDCAPASGSADVYLTGSTLLGFQKCTWKETTCNNQYYL